MKYRRGLVHWLVVVLSVAMLCLSATGASFHTAASARGATQAAYLPIILRNYEDYLRLDGYALAPPHPRVTSGQSFTVLYRITNRTAQAQTAYLIARARDPLGVFTLLETTTGSGVYAVAVSVAPGSAWYERTVVAPPYTPAGAYNLVWIVSATSYWGDQVAGAYEPNAFDVLSAYP